MKNGRCVLTCEGGGQVLRVSVAHQEVDPRKATHDHVVHGIASGTTHTNDADLGGKLGADVGLHVLLYFVCVCVWVCELVAGQFGNECVCVCVYKNVPVALSELFPSLARGSRAIGSYSRASQRPSHRER